MLYAIDEGNAELRQRLKEQLFGLDLVDPGTREMIVTAWTSVLRSSTYSDLANVPWDPTHTSYSLLRHVNEVTRLGIGFAQLAAQEWGKDVDEALLTQTLILHDVDKPLLYRAEGDRFVYTPLKSELPHGIIGGMLLKELGFPALVITTVSMHSPSLPFRGTSPEAWVLFYADHFCCDRELLRVGKEPIYRRLTPPLA